VLTVSAKEAALIDDFVGTPGHAQVLPDFEDLERSARPVDERTGILFIGNFRHLPNVEAVTWLFQEIVPLLDPKLLDLHPLTVVGNDLTPDLIKRCGGDRPGINWVGWVPQIEPYLDKARLVLAPLRTGAGTKRKLLQALMMGTPIVTTSIGAEGLDLVADEHVLIADNARDLAVSTERLATDDALWSSLATAGRAHVEARHGPQSVRAPFERLLAMCKP
jgi:glycosyltransferase involved in cell wall biosynthesis